MPPYTPWVILIVAVIMAVCIILEVTRAENAWLDDFRRKLLAADTSDKLFQIICDDLRSPYGIFEWNQEELNRLWSEIVGMIRITVISPLTVNDCRLFSEALYRCHVEDQIKQLKRIWYERSTDDFLMAHDDGDAGALLTAIDCCQSDHPELESAVAALWDMGLSFEAGLELFTKFEGSHRFIGRLMETAKDDDDLKKILLVTENSSSRYFVLNKLMYASNDYNTLFDAVRQSKSGHEPGVIEAIDKMALYNRQEGASRK